MARRMMRESSTRAVKTLSSIASVSCSASRMTGPNVSTMLSLDWGNQFCTCNLRTVCIVTNINA